MPTAEMAREWEKETVQAEEWTEPKAQPTSWSWGQLAPKAGLGTVHVDRRLKEEIEHAKRILTLEEDWDGEGSPVYSEGTLNRAIAFLMMHLEQLWRQFGVCPPIPKIGPGPDGSVDLHWREPSWELLVNIPADTNELAAFYGDNYGAQKIKGSLESQKFNLGIAEWLMN